MVILALETSGDLCSIALARGAVVLSETVFPHERRLAERLPQLVSAVFDRAGIGAGEVDALAAGTGPGSFTGVRVAVTFAKAWAWATGKRAIGIPGFPAMAATFGADRIVVGMAPCRRGEAIVWLGGDEYRVVEVTAITDLLGARNPGRTVLAAGEAAALLTPNPSVSIEPRQPLASEIALAAWKILGSGALPDPNSLAPLYVAPPPIRQGGLQ